MYEPFAGPVGSLVRINARALVGAEDAAASSRSPRSRRHIYYHHLVPDRLHLQTVLDFKRESDTTEGGMLKLIEFAGSVAQVRRRAHEPTPVNAVASSGPEDGAGSAGSGAGSDAVASVDVDHATGDGFEESRLERAPEDDQRGIRLDETDTPQSATEWATETLSVLHHCLSNISERERGATYQRVGDGMRQPDRLGSPTNVSRLSVNLKLTSDEVKYGSEVEGSVRVDDADHRGGLAAILVRCDDAQEGEMLLTAEFTEFDDEQEDEGICSAVSGEGVASRGGNMPTPERSIEAYAGSGRLE